MSNIYIQEPPTSGKIIMKTTIGDIEVELWAKEAPLACRNFIQLCMEGYYDDTIFHRVIKGFIVQGGDPTGTGTGGESIYGKTFKDEFHSRLRFNRRGLVAMANSEKDDNGSQFFFTLEATPELQNKHTIFGKVTGDTIFNVLKLETTMVDQDEKPIYPQKILSTEVLNNPFNDIVPRITKSTKEKKEKKPEKKKIKNFKLLSFGDEAEEDEELSENLNKRFKNKSKGMSAHDIIEDPKLSSQTFNIDDEVINKDFEDNKKVSDEDEISEKNETPEEVTKVEMLEKVKQEFKNLKRDLYKSKKKTQEIEVKKNTEEKEPKKPSLYNIFQTKEAYKEKSLIPSKKDHSRQDMTVMLLSKFKSQVQNTSVIENAQEDNRMDEEDSEECIAYTLRCTEQAPVLAKDANQKDDEWFDIYDPRNPLNKRRRGERPGDKPKGKKPRN